MSDAAKKNDWDDVVQSWFRTGANFRVKISHWTVAQTKWADPGEGLNRWGVYGCIWATHPWFARIQPNGDYCQEAVAAIPLHGGCTYLRGHTDGQGVLSAWEIGADYHHLHDRRFTHYETLERAAEIQQDADELFRWLEDPSSGAGADIETSPIHALIQMGALKEQS